MKEITLINQDDDDDDLLVESVEVNGSAQRSIVTSLTFNGDVTLDPGAITLTGRDGRAVDLRIVTQGIIGGSLADGGPP